MTYTLRRLCQRNRDGSHATQSDRMRVLTLIARQSMVNTYKRCLDVGSAKICLQARSKAAFGLRREEAIKFQSVSADRDDRKVRGRRAGASAVYRLLHLIKLLGIFLILEIGEINGAMNSVEKSLLPFGKMGKCPIMDKCFGHDNRRIMKMNNDFSSFVIEIKNKSDVDHIMKYIKNYLNIEKYYEGDSSYYLMDTYWLADQGFWKIKFFYTDCNETKNKYIRKGNIYYGVFIDSSFLNKEFISIVSKFIYELIKVKYNVILDDDILPDISEESNQLLASFLLNS